MGERGATEAGREGSRRVIWFLIALLLVGSVALGAYAVRQLQRDPKPVEDLRAAIHDLEVEIGKELEPVLRRIVAALERLNRK